MKALVLAAGRGKRFGAKTKILPKCLIPLDNKGTNLLKIYLDAFRKLGIKDVVIVVGHLKEKIIRECKKSGFDLNIQFIENPEFVRGSLVSLYTARKELNTWTLIMDADVYFKPNQIKNFLKEKGNSTFLADNRSKSAGEEMMLMSKAGRIVNISKKLKPGLKIVGEATGFFKVNPTDAKKLAKILEKFYKKDIKDVEYEEAYCDLMKKSILKVEFIKGFWSEMDFIEDRAIIAAKI